MLWICLPGMLRVVNISSNVIAITSQLQACHGLVSLWSCWGRLTRQYGVMPTGLPLLLLGQDAGHLEAKLASALQDVELLHTASAPRTVADHTFMDHGRKVFKLSGLIQAFRVARLLRDSSKIMKALELSLSYLLQTQDANCLIEKLRSDRAAGKCNVPSEATLSRARFRTHQLLTWD